MSLIIAIPTTQGITLGSDTLMVLGQVKERTSKIFQLSSRICWSGTGEYALVQRVSHALQAFQDSNLTLRDLASSLANVVKSCVRDLLNADFRTDMYISNINAVSSLHRADFVFAEWAGGAPAILHLNVFGSPVWINDKPFFIGAGDSLAGMFFQRYRTIPLTKENAGILAYRLIDEVIESGMYGLGAPIDLWQLDDAGGKQLSEGDIRAMQEALQAIRRNEVAVFEHHLAMSVSH